MLYPTLSRICFAREFLFKQNKVSAQILTNAGRDSESEALRLRIKILIIGINIMGIITYGQYHGIYGEAGSTCFVVLEVVDIEILRCLERRGGTPRPMITTRREFDARIAIRRRNCRYLMPMVMVDCV